MATPRFAWGIDIGNRALKAIKLIRDGDAVRVDDFDVIEHETVLSNSGDNRESLITTALNTFAQRHPMKGGAVSVGVSGQSSFARFIKLPPVEDKRIPEIVRFEAIQQIPFPLDDVEWSYQLFRTPESPDVEVGIFAMRKELINQHIKNFTDADMNVQVVQMNPLAVYNAMMFDGRIDGTTMIIDMGAENTDLIIADADTVWLRSIPIGGNNFTETLVKSFKLNFPKAEDLKRNAATSKYARQIFQAMRPVFADLVAEVQRSIGFYASVHRDSRIRKIVAVGGAFKLPGLQKYLQQNLQLDVERMDTLGGGAPPDPKQAAMFQDNILSLVSAYGLGLQAMGEGKISSSLLPAHIRRERMWQEKTKFFAAAAALFAVGTGIGFASVFLGDIKYESVAGERQKIASVQSQASALDSQWSEIAGKGGPDRQRVLNLRSMLEYRDMFTQILNDIEKSVPVLHEPPEKIKEVKRNERKMAKIDSITSTYYPDLAQVTSLLPFATETGQPTSGFGGAPSGFGPAAAMGGGIGGGVMEGAMPTPDPSATPPADGTAAAPTGRGYVIRIAGTTPFATAERLIAQTVIKTLQDTAKANDVPPKPYRFEKVELVYLKPLKDNTNRLSAMKQAYDAAVAAKQSGTFTPPAGTPGFGGFGGGFNGGGEGVMDGRGGFGGFGGGFGGAPVAPGAPVDQELAFKDRQFPDEDIREDQEFVAVAMVLIDPPPPAAPADGAAPPPADGTAPAPVDGAAAAPAADGATPAAPQ